MKISFKIHLFSLGVFNGFVTYSAHLHGSHAKKNAMFDVRLLMNKDSRSLITEVCVNQLNRGQIESDLPCRIKI